MSKDQRRMDRFIVIPFSSTCRSGSSVDVVDSRHGKKPQGGGEGAAAGGAGKPKGESLLARLLKGFKNLSRIFAVYEEDEEEEEEEKEMVIGLPTDVKHVAHIGWDGSTSTTTSVRSWNRATPPPAAAASTSCSPAAPPPQSQSPLPPALSVRQFELAMAAQAAAGTGAASAASTSTSSTATTTARHCHS